MSFHYTGQLCPKSIFHLLSSGICLQYRLMSDDELNLFVKKMVCLMINEGKDSPEYSPSTDFIIALHAVANSYGVDTLDHIEDQIRRFIFTPMSGESFNGFDVKNLQFSAAFIKCTNNAFAQIQPTKDFVEKSLSVIFDFTESQKHTFMSKWNA
ncbi:hypothetical protein QGN29_14330 [Temperatibacter marinus]|uniref:Uncharacterized protein n=1 Tax=Temperatibacter marinus TaxID=1456591 RepID=A0AA52EH73_9PROT|nr:hypothetical protein [Temperatibacter marinus]WND02725.1 hypothetical protein QGN29_14330 [Temperatibacter marinus]